MKNPETACDHPWHRNPGLVTPCPACGEGDENDHRGPFCVDECPNEPHDHTFLDLAAAERWTDDELAEAEAAVERCKSTRLGANP